LKLDCQPTCRYEAKLLQEADTILRLKGENGLLKKKFNEFQKDIEEQKTEIKQLFDQKKELYSTLGFFERDIAYISFFVLLN
jgi:chromosome segregation ATPase